MRHLLLLCSAFILGYSQATAQFTDNFSDGNFTANPRWTGDSAVFKINSSHQLQLNTSGAGTAILSTGNLMLQDMEWSFWIKLSFSPSDNNLAWIYLSSDHADLKDSLNGYYLKFGENGSNDAIELVKQSGITHTVICRGTDGFLTAPFAIRIKVIWTSGDWKVFADQTGGVNYQLQASGTDNTFTTGTYFGIYCKYTSSNSTKFYFDDFSVGNIIVDNTPPKVSSVIMEAANEITVNFSEPVTSQSATNSKNYTTSPGSGVPDTVLQELSDMALLHLSFSKDFITDSAYNLYIIGIKDLAGNEILPVQIPFMWHQAKEFDILINEIMADPTPSVKLPEAEYVELYNKSTLSVDLKDWTLELGSSKKIFPRLIIPARGYVILCDDSTYNSLKTYGPAIGFSSFIVTNTGSTITLKDQNGNIIHTVNYTDGWYKSNYKKDGGWSLELIDPSNPCGESSNWKASEDESGGTPGKKNSVYASNPDLTAPVISRVGVQDNLNITVWFSEPCDSNAIAIATNYSIDNGVGSPVQVLTHRPDFSAANLTLASPMVSGTIYTLSCNNTILDCVGNHLTVGSSARFAIPAAAEGHDIIINELLFDPPESCVDFIEVLNRSSKVLDLRDMILANYDTITQSILNYYEISTQPYLIFPEEYIVLSTDSAAIKKFYKTPNPYAFINMASFPAMNNDEGQVALETKGGTVIDLVCYTASMQYPLLASVDGVSLERISPERPSNDLTNWHSASETAGYSTPAYKNSQFSMTLTDDGAVSVSPEIFSPDNDGHNDILNFAYTFGMPGYNITITIFDETGHIVRNLVNHELCGISGTFSWDGLANNHLKASIGRYIILVETFDLQGNLKRYKKTTVLGGKL